MEKEEQELRTNKSELKGQLQDLVDTEKYLKIIEERNREIEKEKMEGRPEYEQEKREEKQFTQTGRPILRLTRNIWISWDFPYRKNR